MPHIRNVKNIFLNGTKITDDGILQLTNCHTLDLHGKGISVTNRSIKELGKCHTLNLKWAKTMTNETLYQLRNCHTLDLTCCVSLTLSP